MASFAHAISIFLTSTWVVLLYAVASRFHREIQFTAWYHSLRLQPRWLQFFPD